MASKAVPAEGRTATQAASPLRELFRQRAAAQDVPDRAAARAGQAAAVQLVEGGRTAPPLARVRGFKPFADEAAAQLAQRRAAIREQVGRGDLTAQGAARQEASAMAEHRQAVLARVTAALADLDSVRAEFPPVRPLGSVLVMPKDRADIADHVAAVAQATPMQFAAMLRDASGGAGDSADVLLARGIAWAGRGQLGGRWARDPQRVVVEQALQDAAARLADPRELAGQYAAAVADQLEAALQVLGTALERDGYLDPAYEAAHAWAPFDAPPPDAPLADLFDRVVGLDPLPALLKLAPDGGLASRG